MTPAPRLRDYQCRAVDGVRDAWARHTAILLVAPTGSGKTRMGVELVGGSRTVWLAHRRELVRQAAGRFRESLGDAAVSTKDYPRPDAQVYVSTVQSLARGEAPFTPELLVLDEAHHYAADTWSEVARRYPHARWLGLTATPERADGRPLGDMFGEMVVAAHYSELIAAGHLVPSRIVAPSQSLGRNLAQPIVDAYRERGEERRGFVFVPNVSVAYETAADFGRAGISAKVIVAKSPTEERDRAIAEFSSGAVRLLVNVYCLTEGVDIPEASLCVFARQFEHAGQYLQAAGRVLRPAPGKLDALFLDLTGTSYKHGPPTRDRRYSLEGRGISTGAKEEPRDNSETRASPDARRIFNVELREVYAGRDTPREAKARELARILDVCRRRRYPFSWGRNRYFKLFDEKPSLLEVTTPEERAEELARLRATARERGYRPGWAAYRYRDAFDRWPPDRSEVVSD